MQKCQRARGGNSTADRIRAIAGNIAAALHPLHPAGRVLLASAAAAAAAAGGGGGGNAEDEDETPPLSGKTTGKG